MRALTKKLWRELWQMRGQALAIALVILSGVAIFVMSLSTLDSLYLTRQSYYQEYRFAELFAELKRAPNGLQARIRDLPGVDQVETRVVALVKLDLPGFADPVTGKLVSLPDRGEPLQNRLYLRHGRLVAPGRNNEVVVNEAFANLHGLAPGDSLAAIINGKRQTLTIVGIALSPEYIYQLAPGATVPDFKRFAILWMARTPLESAYDMQGAFNDVLLRLAHGADRETVITRLDRLLERYGGRGAYARKDQVSHHFLNEELRQLRTLATAFPVIFFSVAAFLLNIVISRIIALQREEIASLKAFGYSNLAIGLHYIQLVLVIVAFGVAGGLLCGVWLGQGLSEIYIGFYRFPYLQYVLQPGVMLSAALISVVVAVLGTLYAIRRAALMPPAQAMRPEPPAVYRAALVERLGLQRWLSQPTRMITRNIERRPLKSALSMLGIAAACGVMMVGNFQGDAIDYMVDVQFNRSQREDIALSFTEPTSKRALYSLRTLPGVEYVEGARTVPVRIRFENRSYRTVIYGSEPDSQLSRVLDSELRPVVLPDEGVVINDHLGRTLGVRPGDQIILEVLEGSRPIKPVVVAAIAKQYLGMGAYMQRRALNRLMQEGDVISGAYLAVDSDYQDRIYAELRDMPRVVGTRVRSIAVKNFYAILAETILFFTFITTVLGATIAFGVVYNTARIALAERGHELASLRVLGFSRGEIAYILLGELALLTLVAIPLGFLVGRGLCAYLVARLQTDLYRVPLVLEPDTYAFAALVVLLSATVSGVMIWRQLGRLDLLAVLKTRE
ncbi:MAG TPA: ABC transporter permease [Gammaproteobacteria bacterium]|nr:ABC transporter permease [Gammaproteobacteria bacterium]